MTWESRRCRLAAACPGSCSHHSPGDGPLVETDNCFHCGGTLEGEAFQVHLRTLSEDTNLALCRSCQGLVQEGQLPVELLLQQWQYHRGARDPESDPFESLQVRLDCLGCGASLASNGAPSGGRHTAAVPNFRRMPDGSTVAPCAACGRTNVLERRGAQMIAVRLW